MKHLFSILFVCTIGLALSSNVYAYDDQKLDQTVSVAINDEVIQFTDAQPFLYQGTTYVPIKFLSSALKAEIGYFPSKKTSWLKKDEKFMSIVQNENYIMDEQGNKYIVDGTTVNGRTVVPLRLISQQFGYTVTWLKNENTGNVVRITNSNKVLNNEEFLKLKDKEILRFYKNFEYKKYNQYIQNIE